MTLRNFNFIRKDRISANQGGSVACIINSNFQYRSLSPRDINAKLEWILLEMKVDSKTIHIFNCYKPPDTSLSEAEWSALLTILDALPNLIIVGDLNAHHFLWGSDLSNPDGNHLADAINNSNLCVLNSGACTRIHTNQFLKSVPDVSLVSADIFASMRWSVEDDARGSDHFPIAVLIHGLSFSRCRTKPKIGVKKVKWDKFNENIIERCNNVTVDSNNYLEVYEELVENIKLSLKEAGA